MGSGQRADGPVLGRAPSPGRLLRGSPVVTLDARIVWRSIAASWQGKGFSQEGPAQDRSSSACRAGTMSARSPRTGRVVACRFILKSCFLADLEGQSESSHAHATHRRRIVLPTDAEMALTRTRVLRFRAVLSDEVIDEAVRGAERHFAGERDASLSVESGFADWKPGDPDAIKNSEFVTLQNAQIRALPSSRRGAIAARLTGSDTIRLWDDQLVSNSPTPKTRRGASRLAHRSSVLDDMHLARDAHGLDPIPRLSGRMGPVMYIEGSHRWPETMDESTFNSQDFNDLQERAAGVAEA